MLKWPNTPAAEPAGALTTWLYAQCMMGQGGYTHNYNQALQGVANPTPVEQYHASRAAQTIVGNWARSRTAPNSTLHPFDNRPGLTLSLVPVILAENGLRAVRGTAAIAQELGGTALDVETMLTAHGPLYCLVNFGHVVVVTGINGTTIDVCDPLLPAPNTQHVNWVINSPCVARVA